MIAEKANKTYTITDEQAEGYCLAGYDIKDDAGKIVSYGYGKTVSYEEYAKVLAENEALKAELKSCHQPNGTATEEKAVAEEKAAVKTSTRKKAGE